jgi:HSP20 family protein
MTLVKVNNAGQKQFGSLVDQLFSEFPVLGQNLGLDYTSFPPVNIHETPEAYHLELNVPGRAKEDFKITAENGLLTISYEKKQESKTEEFKTIRREFSYRSFKRSFNIDHEIDSDKIQAKYENGLLKLLLPKKAEAKQSSKQINID